MNPRRLGRRKSTTPLTGAAPPIPEPTPSGGTGTTVAVTVFGEPVS
jgi:hypothetical protein